MQFKFQKSIYNSHWSPVNRAHKGPSLWDRANKQWERTEELKVIQPMFSVENIPLNLYRVTSLPTQRQMYIMMMMKQRASPYSESVQIGSDTLFSPSHGGWHPCEERNQPKGGRASSAFHQLLPKGQTSTPSLLSLKSNVSQGHLSLSIAKFPTITPLLLFCHHQSSKICNQFNRPEKLCHWHAWSKQPKKQKNQSLSSQRHLPSFFFITLLANSKQITKNPTPAAPPTTMATVFSVCPDWYPTPFD